MQKQMAKCIRRIEGQGIACGGDILLLCRDAEVFANRPRGEWPAWCGDAFDRLNVNAFMFAQPAEPYRSLIDHLLSGPPAVFRRRHGPGGEHFVPRDCETRTFFHDIPIVRGDDPERLWESLSRRRSVVLAGRGIASYGLMTPDQAVMALSSACFSLFVNYFTDILEYLEGSAVRGEAPDEELLGSFRRVLGLVLAGDGSDRQTCRGASSGLAGSPLRDDDVIAMLCETGERIVARRLVDSFFGNISYVFDDRIFISQTGSSLDELAQCVDEVPLDGSSTAGITASSELPAHIGIHRATGDRAILHGHPKYAVALSMCCTRRDCDRSLCYTACPHERDLRGIPIVAGEIGTGPTGLLHTVPDAMKRTHAAIVYGHGVFTSGKTDFRKPFQMLCSIEDMAKDEYLRRLKSALGAGASGFEHFLDSDHH